MGQLFNFIKKRAMISDEEIKRDDLNTGQDVAIKIMKSGHKAEANFKAMKTEYDVLLQLDHPNIIKLLELNDSGTYTKRDGTVKNGKVYAALELAQNGEIFDYLANTGRFSEPVARFYFRQL